MKEDKIPKIFISYSWSSDEIVIPLAERLVSHGVDVVLDKWDLKEGQDKYAFMEQCVNDPGIDKVLIICDKKYEEKANNREGGVGDETVIISTEIYGNVEQEKFIPVIAEYNDDGEPCVPTYIKSRIHVDLSDKERYEEEYEKLLRNIYNKPLIKKPKLGAKPEWLEEDKTNLFPIQDLVKQIKGAINCRKQQVLVRKFVTEYIDILKQYHEKGVTDSNVVFDAFMETKVIRDVFLDFLDAVMELDVNIGDLLCEIFETLYNTLIYVKTYSPNGSSYNDYEFDVYKCHIWELFICTVAFLRHYAEYKILNTLLSNTYFLRDSPLEERKVPTNYSRFRHHSRVIEEIYKPTTEKKNNFTLLGDMICHQREKQPIYSGESLAQADLFLYQVFEALNLTINDEYVFYDSYWFPNLYVYTREGVTEWAKMKSKKYAEKMFTLFGVSSIEELKNAISKCVPDNKMKYSGAFDFAPSILNCIKVDEIGTIN